MVLESLGDIHFTISQYRQAKDYLDRARQLFESLQIFRALFRVWNALGNVWKAQGDQSRALIAFDTSFSYLRQEQGVFSRQNLQAAANGESSLADSSIPSESVSGTILRSPRNSTADADTDLEIQDIDWQGDVTRGHEYFGAGNYKRAIECYRRCCVVADKYSGLDPIQPSDPVPKGYLPSICYLLGLAYQIVGDFPKAIFCLFPFLLSIFFLPSFMLPLFLQVIVVLPSFWSNSM